MKNVRPAYLIIFAASLFILAAAVVYTVVIKRAAPPAPAEETVVEETAGEETSAPDNAAAPDSALADFSGSEISGVAVKEPDMFDKIAEGDKNRKFHPVTLESADITVAAQEDYVPSTGAAAGLSAQSSGDEGSVRTMLTAPVGYRIISAQAEYDKFKKTAYGNYPKIDFSKKSFLILESKSNLPDNIFEIQKVRKDGGKTVVDFDLNILGLKDRPSSNAYAVIDKNVKTVELNQVM